MSGSGSASLRRHQLRAVHLTHQFRDSPYGNQKKLRVTRGLAFEIIQRRKQAYWEFGALFRMTRDREGKIFANWLF
jgi:hypothetical protein